MSRKQLKRRAGDMTRSVIVGIFILLVIVGGVGFGVASADTTDDLASRGAFGFDEATCKATIRDHADAFGAEAPGAAIGDSSALVSASPRDISSGLRMMDEREAVEEEAVQKENAAAVERVEAGKAKQGVVSVIDSFGAPQSSDAIEYSLAAVDWSVGKGAFVSEWGERIDVYLEGSPLAGYGRVFAEAAWDNGVDPRWSPAISNTESGKGSVCFLPCNAWGWGSSSWPDWDTAIRAHTAGLAEGYGYSLTLAAAQAYCPPNAESWYRVTLGQMDQI